MNRYSKKQLKDVCSIIVSNVDKKAIPNESKVRLCNYMDVYSNSYIHNYLNFMEATANRNEMEKYTLRINDVIITKDSETPDDIASPAVVTGLLDNVVCGYHLAILRPNSESLDGKYLMFYIKLDISKNYFANRASGSTRYGLSIAAIQDFKLLTPPLPVQRKIAHILSTVDRQIEKTKQLIRKYEMVKEGMMQDLFTRGIDMKSGGLRPSYGDAPGLYKETELGFVPKEWEIRKIKELVQEGSPVTYGIVQPGSFSSNGVLLIRGQDYISGWATEHEFFKVSQKLHAQFRRSTTSKGDILICIVGATTGAVQVVPNWIVEANITQTTARIRCDANRIDSEYLQLFLKSSYGKKLVSKYVKGSAQPGLNLGDVEEFKILMPIKLLEQKAIQSKLNSIINSINISQLHEYKLQYFKHGLMQDLLAGKIPVST